MEGIVDTYVKNDHMDHFEEGASWDTNAPPY